MNNFLKNQIRRANCALTTKAVLFAYALLRPGKIWRTHAEHIQDELDGEHGGSCYSYPYVELHPSRCRRGWEPVL